MIFIIHFCLLCGMYRTHFVLLTGYSLSDEDSFAVNDPASRVIAISHTKDIVGYRIFDMIRK